MKLENFIEEVVGSGLRGEHFRRCFEPEVLRRWLAKKKWVEDSDSPCLDCKWKEENWNGKFSEEKCQANVKAGGYCYREILRTIFFPFVIDATKGKAPSIRDIQKVVYEPGEFYGGHPQARVIDIIDHELGGMRDTIAAEKYRKRKKLT